MIPLFPAPETRDRRRALPEAPGSILEQRRALQLDGLIGSGEAMARLFQRIRPAAALERLHVLLTGPTGSGKSLVARAIHRNGERALGPFVEVNCAAIPRDLFEAEFFGCAKNAYTQATDRSGRFAAAEGGTLLLDEIGELPLRDQSKLLRVLDEGHYERLGEDRTRHANVRILAATNRDLDAAVAAGAFREDLYFRLNRYRIHVPSLAERGEDLAELAAHVADEQCKALGVPCIALSAEATRALERREWPGNVRELQSVVAQAVIEAHCQGAPAIELRHLAGGPAAGDAAHPARGGREPLYAEMTYADATREFQRRMLAATLDEEDWNITRAAQRLALARSHIYTLIEHFKLERPGGGGAR